MLREQLPELKSALSVSPALLYGYKLKTLLDNWLIRGAECAAILEEGPRRVTYHGEAGAYSRLLPLLCGKRGIPYEEHLLPSGSAPAFPYRSALRPLAYHLRRWSRMARNWRVGDPCPEAARLTLLFLESTCDLNDLLNSALRNKHRCLVREGSHIVDLSQGGRTLFSMPGNGKGEDLWNRAAEELFDPSSSLWGWIRDGWGLPIEKLLAEPLKEWVRTELAQTAFLAGAFRGFYRREEVDFVITPVLVSNPHAAAVAACGPGGKTQSVLIAHGDGSDVKPAWDLFELAPYQHYFVPSSEFAEYFEKKRDKIPFPTARTHVGSYRWRNYSRLRHSKKRIPMPVPAGKPVVVYPVCQPETDIRYLNTLGYSETGYYRLQKHLLSVFSEFPEYTFVVKLFPPETAKDSAIAKWLGRSGAKNILFSSVPFSRWLPWADRVLLDWTSTPLHETALAGVPLHLLLSHECKTRPAAMERFSGLFTPFSSTEEAGQAVRKFLSDPAPQSARIRPEGEEILSQLAGLRKGSPMETMVK